MMAQVAYQLTMPRARTTCLVFASAHSGRDYPASFLSSTVLDEHTIRSSEDAFVDVLFAAAPRFGAPLLAATAPRAFVDLNRSAEELDAALIEDVRRTGANPRVSSGLGVIPRVVSNGLSIYRGKLPRTEVEARLRQVWRPYHTRLQALLDESHEQFGQAILLDCHSMPHEAIETISQGRTERPDIVLGDRFGAAAGSEIVEQVEAAFVHAGLQVTRNTPFAGAFTAQHYGHPSRNQHVIQIEIDRSLYMNERTIRRNDNFDELKSILTQVIAEIAAFGRASMPLAAE
jgi:N-formylglutamate deformylase